MHKFGVFWGCFINNMDNCCLSECMTMVVLAIQDPQSSNAITMGKNSRTEM